MKHKLYYVVLRGKNQTVGNLIRKELVIKADPDHLETVAKIILYKNKDFDFCEIQNTWHRFILAVGR